MRTIKNETMCTVETICTFENEMICTITNEKICTIIFVAEDGMDFAERLIQKLHIYTTGMYIM